MASFDYAPEDLLRLHEETGSPPLDGRAPEDWLRMEGEDGNED